MFKETDRKWLAWAIVVALILVSTITGVSFPIPPIPEATDIGAQGVSGQVSSLTGLQVAAPTVIATATPALMVDSLGVSNHFEVRDAATPVFTVGDGGAVTLQGLLLSSFADLTVTDGYTLTAAYTTYALDTAGAVTITLAATGQEGQLLVLINDDANATIIADTNVRTSTGAAITLAGAYDTIAFVFQDSEWLELFTIANS